MKQYVVDAFTDKPFCGNPAAVLVMDRWIPDETMQAIAAENNLAETAFVVREGERYRIRWFTPSMEEELCGHATLAASFVLLSFYEPEADGIRYCKTKWIGTAYPIPKVGEQVDLVYDEGKPEKVKIVYGKD